MTETTRRHALAGIERLQAAANETGNMLAREHHRLQRLRTVYLPAQEERDLQRIGRAIEQLNAYRAELEAAYLELSSGNVTAGYTAPGWP